MTKRKDILTTGQVAQIRKVAPRTVTKWFDSGQLKGYRIPGSRDRRIPQAELVRFMKAHNIRPARIARAVMALHFANIYIADCMALVAQPCENVMLDAVLGASH